MANILWLAAILCCHIVLIQGKYISKRYIRQPENSTDGPYLPRHVTPSGYYVYIQPIIEENYFKGYVKINVTCLVATNTVILHAAEDLDISNAEMSVIQPSKVSESRRSRGPTSHSNLSVIRVRRTNPDNWLEVLLSESMQPSAMYQLMLEFSGTLNNASKRQGLFYGSYSIPESHGKRYYVLADMKQNRAHKVFPCFDELSYKAPFEIVIARAENMNSLSNMVIETSQTISTQPGWETDHFKRSPPMSTFSVVIFVYDPSTIAPLKLIENVGYTIHIYGRPDKLENLENTTELITSYVQRTESLLQMNYPLPDLQILILPEQTQSYDGFGLMVFGEQNTGCMKWTWKHMKHLPYQWIGHLATPHFWSESDFSNSLGFYISLAVLSDSVKNTELSDIFYWGAVFHSAYGQYGKAKAENTLSKIDHMIKGAWLFRMLNYTIAPNTFQTALNKFLYDRSYKTFVADDFLVTLKEQVRRDHALPWDNSIRDITKSWLETGRYPVVTVFRDYEQQSAFVDQRIFIYDEPEDLDEKEKSTLWWIPLISLTNMNVDDNLRLPVAWLKGQKSLTLKYMPPADDFLIINPDEIGMFLVNYDPTNWALISKYLWMSSYYSNLPEIPLETRAKLLNDAQLLSYSGELNYGILLNLTLFLPHDASIPTWLVFENIVEGISQKLRSTRLIQKFRDYVKHLADPVYTQFGGYQDIQLEKEKMSLKELVQEIMCKVGADDCISAMESSQTVYNDSYCIVLAWGSEEAWENALDIAIGRGAHQDINIDLLKNIAWCTEAPHRVFRLLTTILINNTLADKDIKAVIEGIGNNYAFFSFLTDEWVPLKKKFTNNLALLGDIVYSCMSKFVTSDGYDLVSNFFMHHEDEPMIILTALENSLQQIVKTSKWYDRSVPEIEVWINWFFTERPMGMFA